MTSRLALAVRRLIASDDRVAGCDAVLDSDDVTPDDELDYHLLFGDVLGSPRKIARRRRDLEELLGGS